MELILNLFVLAELLMLKHCLGYYFLTYCTMTSTWMLHDFFHWCNFLKGVWCSHLCCWVPWIHYRNDSCYSNRIFFIGLCLNQGPFSFDPWPLKSQAITQSKHGFIKDKRFSNFYLTEDLFMSAGCKQKSFIFFRIKTNPALWSTSLVLRLLFPKAPQNLELQGLSEDRNITISTNLRSLVQCSFQVFLSAFSLTPAYM